MDLKDKNYFHIKQEKEERKWDTRQGVFECLHMDAPTFTAHSMNQTKSSMSPILCAQPILNTLGNRAVL